MSNDILSLPQELLIQILANLDAVSLVRSALTCKSLYETLKSSSQLVYILQLHFDGFSDAGTSASYSDLIRKLLHRRQLWFASEWKGRAIFDMQTSSQAYELVGGAFATTDGDRFEVVWPTFGHDDRTKIEEATGLPVRDFAMDPTQDLVAFMDDDAPVRNQHSNIRVIRIHIRTISKNEVHPRARQSFLECSVHHVNQSLNSHIHSVVLQLVRNTLTLYFCVASERAPPRVLVWDWTTSELIMDSALSFHPFVLSLHFDFTLLDSTFCLITQPLDSGSIWVYQLPRSLANNSNAILLAKLHLPPTSINVNVTHISMHAGPIEAHPLPNMAFTVNDDDRLHAFRITYRHTRLFEAEYGPNPVSVKLFVHQRVFMEYCRQRGHQDGSPIDVP